jgi:hypothetical protein
MTAAPPCSADHGNDQSMLTIPLVASSFAASKAIVQWPRSCRERKSVAR